MESILCNTNFNIYDWDGGTVSLWLGKLRFNVVKVTVIFHILHSFKLDVATECISCWFFQNEWLVQRQEERSAGWSAFVNKMCDRCNTMDDEFASEVKRVKDYYKELEQKMMRDEVPKDIWSMACCTELSISVIFIDTRVRFVNFLRPCVHHLFFCHSFMPPSLSCLLVLLPSLPCNPSSVKAYITVGTNISDLPFILTEKGSSAGGCYECLVLNVLLSYRCWELRNLTWVLI